MATNAVSRVVFVFIALLVALVLIVVVPKTPLNESGYELPTGSEVSINTKIPSGAICDRTLNKAGFPFVTKKPYHDDKGGCNNLVDQFARELNVLSALLVGAGISVAVVASIRKLTS